MITERLTVPTLGIGAGPVCDGQVLVIHDMLGFTEGHVPSFVRKYAELGATVREACRRFVEDVRSGEFPSDAEASHLKGEVLEEVRGGLGPAARRRWRS
jgi:3-methyl-2-oxobutanoate hydroxymethyltransferase